MMQAKLLRAGELTAARVPDAAHEAKRDLVRTRATGARLMGKARQHLRGSCCGTVGPMPGRRAGQSPAAAG